MIRHAFSYEGKKYDIRGIDYVDFAEKVLKAVHAGNNTPTVNEWHSEFITAYKSTRRPRTIISYQQRYNKHIKPVIGDMMISEVKHSDCQKILSSLKGYSNDSIKKIYNDLWQLFDKAILNGYITSSPMVGIEKGSGSRYSRVALTNDEIICTLQTVRETGIGACYLGMMYCGLRPHETALIQGKDIVNDVLHIRGVKTSLADRYVPIPTVLKEFLPEVEPEEYVFKSIEGLAPTTEAHRAKTWIKFKKLMTEVHGSPVRKEVVPYSFRHTYCTSLQDAGVPLNIIKQLMGHSNLNTTQRYLHNSCQLLESSTSLINSYFNGLSLPTSCQF